MRVGTLEPDLYCPAGLKLHLRHTLASLQPTKQGLDGMHRVSFKLLYLLAVSDGGAPEEADSAIFRLHGHQVQCCVACAQQSTGDHVSNANWLDFDGEW